MQSYYASAGGFVISAAIDKYVYIGVNRTFTKDYLVKYSQTERTVSADDLQHPIFREVFQLLDVRPGIEVVSLADIPAGTGLGSSGSFTVGLLRALYADRRVHISTGDLAETACHVEIDRLGESIGKQDQYIAAYGGITCFEFGTDGSVSVEPLRLSPSTLQDLENNLVLFFTGYSRSASSILEHQHSQSVSGDDLMRRNLDETKALGYQIRQILEQDDPDSFGALLNDHWHRKRTRSPGITNPEIDRLYDFGMANGAKGGKLVGAGAGGFLLFYATDVSRLRAAFRARGIEELPFRFDHDGSVIHARS